MIEEEQEMKDKGEGKLSSGTQLKCGEQVEIIEILLCASCYIVNEGETHSTQTAAL